VFSNAGMAAAGADCAKLFEAMTPIMIGIARSKRVFVFIVGFSEHPLLRIRSLDGLQGLPSIHSVAASQDRTAGIMLFLTKNWSF